MKKCSSATMTLSIFVLAVSSVLLDGCIPSNGMHSPRGLMTDLLSNSGDAVITNPEPMFSWIIDDERIGAGQTAYRILVASSEKKLADNGTDIWDSGKILSGQSVSVKYTGSALEPFKSYWWKENRHAIRYHDIKPVSVEINESGNHFIRFEKAAFGTLKLTLDEPEKADTLVVHLGEKLAPGNQVDRNPGGSITYNQVKLPITPGKTEYLVEIPRFISNYPNSQVLAEDMPEVTAFRYAEIEGWPGRFTN
jgi:alpha-L-rhamnosidase